MLNGDILVYYNAALASLAGLEALEEVGGDVLVNHNPCFTSRSGLESLVRVDDGPQIHDNVQLFVSEVVALDAQTVPRIARVAYRTSLLLSPHRSSDGVGHGRRWRPRSAPPAGDAGIHRPSHCGHGARGIRDIRTSMAMA